MDYEDVLELNQSIADEQEWGGDRELRDLGGRALVDMGRKRRALKRPVVARRAAVTYVLPNHVPRPGAQQVMLNKISHHSKAI